MSAEAEARADWLRRAVSGPFVGDLPRRLGVAVSGGGDSMALLDLMVAVGRQKGFEVRAATVDHSLRPEARDELGMVAAHCAARGIGHEVLAWTGWDGRGNLQAKARKARYALIAEWAERQGVDQVALGHTRGDQAETVVMRLARASGVDGLAGMPERFERDGVRFVRPLLRLTRQDLRAYLTDRGISWCEDPSNEDDSYERVRARKAMSVLADLGVDVDTLATVADNARAAKWALDHYAWVEVAENGLAEVVGGDVILPASASADHVVPGEILRRLNNAAIMWITGADYPPRRESMNNLSPILQEAKRHTVAGCLVSLVGGDPQHDGMLRFSREFNAVKDLKGPTDQPWDGRWILDGPHARDLEVRALGEAVRGCPDWRDSEVPRTSLMASPAIWRGETLVAAPLAQFHNGWTAEATGRGKFAKFLLSR